MTNTAVNASTLRRLLRDATVVGLARSAHGAHELCAASLRVLQALVEECGFRTLITDQDWSEGLAIDDHLGFGGADLPTLLNSSAVHWRTQELAESLQWMRAFNERNRFDQLRFAGIDVRRAGANLYDGVIAYYLAAGGPRHADLSALYESLRPRAGIDAHILWYRGRPDKPAFVERARHAYELVAALPPDDDHALALQHAGCIVAFHAFHALDDAAGMSYLEARLAENLSWWHAQTGHKIVYWSGTHAAVGRERTLSSDGNSPWTGRNAGSYLRERFGRRYVSIGLTLRQGEVLLDATLRRVPPPTADFTETLFATDAPHKPCLLDLRATDSDEVKPLLDTPAKLRLFGPGQRRRDGDLPASLSGGTLNEWFDLIIHCGVVTAATPLPRTPAATSADIQHPPSAWNLHGPEP